MSSFRHRACTRGDADTVVSIVRALDEAVLGWSDFTRADLDDEWRTLDPEQTACLVFDGDEPVAYGTIDEKPTPARSDGYVAPSHWGRGVGTFLVTAMEDDLRVRGAETVRNGVLLADEPAQELLRALGYRQVRRFSQMRITLDAPPPEPRWPEDVTAGGLTDDDREAFHAAYEDAFADHWGHVRRSFDEWSADHMTGDDFAPDLWAVVKDGDRIVAGTILIRERNGVAWVSRLFTVRDRRRQGLGEALLHDAFGKFWREGRTTIGLGVDAQSDTGADRLYERVGMRLHWGAAIFEKAL